MTARILRAFGAGASAVVVAHQPLLFVLHGRGLVPWRAWDTAPRPPLGAPALLSAVFWGGVWGIPLAVAVAGGAGPMRRFARAALFGAVAPNAVGALLVAARVMPAPTAAQRGSALAGAVLVNVAWALAAAALLRLAGADGRSGGRSTA